MYYLVVFKHFLFLPLHGEVIQFDDQIFQLGWTPQANPASCPVNTARLNFKPGVAWWHGGFPGNKWDVRCRNHDILWWIIEDVVETEDLLFHNISPKYRIKAKQKCRTYIIGTTLFYKNSQHFPQIWHFLWSFPWSTGNPRTLWCFGCQQRWGAVPVGVGRPLRDATWRDER